MINYNPKSWIKLIFALHKSDTMRMLWKEMTYIALLSLGIAYLELEFLPDNDVLPNLTAVYSLIGFVISLLLVFRTNTAYDRWWEGRKKWGELVNDTRNFTVKFSVMIDNQDDRDYVARMVGNFIFATRDHLRSGVQFEHLELTEEEILLLRKKTHIPMALVKLLYTRLMELKRAGKLSMEDFLVLDHNLNHFLDSLGACERIKNTPIPFSYSLFIKKFIFIYTTTLPLAFVYTFGYYAAVITVYVFYVLVSMEILAEEIEDPFGEDDNDLPTTELSTKIRGWAKENMH